jgi:hypothetical protein
MERFVGAGVVSAQIIAMHVTHQLTWEITQFLLDCINTSLKYPTLEIINCNSREELCLTYGKGKAVFVPIEVSNA